MKSIITALCLLFCLHTFSQTILYVNDDATGAGNGSSWTNAFTKLQDALAKAVSGDQIWVAEGVYYPDEGVSFTDNNRAHSFFLKSGVASYGGFAGTETNLSERNWNTHVTTMSGDIDQDGALANNSYHVVQGDGVHNNPVLDGFTITGGYANGNAVFDKLGGGITNWLSEPIISNCIISGNKAEYSGGGIYNNSSNPSYNNCKITGNTSEGFSSTLDYSNGGGVVNFYGRADFTDCIIMNNVSLNNGGGIYNYNSPSKFTNCKISENKTRLDGGGVLVHNVYPFLDYLPSFINCIISGNSGHQGGGMFNDQSSPVLVNCHISENYGSIGAGIYNRNSSSPTLTNCSFSGNIADFLAGAMANYYNSSPLLTNCSFSGNIATGFVNPDDPADPGTGAFFNVNSSPTFTNCIIWGNSGIQIYNYQSNPIVTYSIVQGGYAGTGNLDQDPLFVDAANGDLHLQKGSPAIDAGLNSANTTTQDLDGNPRVVNGIIDMGAYEFQVTTAPVVITSVTANPSTLWPPNHKMKEVEVTTVTTGGSGNTSCQITAVSSNEPQSGKGKKGLAPDWQIIGTDKVLLRAERNGKGEGRIYTITVTCTDASGSSASKTVQVKVPHDQGKGKAVITEAERREFLNEEAGGRLRAVPNPFYGQTTVHFSVPQSGYTTLDVINATGTVVERLYAAQAEGGRAYALTLDKKQLKSGVYVLRLVMDKYVQTYRLVLMQ